jgi:hypothetical protein
VSSDNITIEDLSSVLKNINQLLSDENLFSDSSSRLADYYKLCSDVNIFSDLVLLRLILRLKNEERLELTDNVTLGLILNLLSTENITFLELCAASSILIRSVSSDLELNDSNNINIEYVVSASDDTQFSTVLEVISTLYSKVSENTHFSDITSIEILRLPHGKIKVIFKVGTNRVVFSINKPEVNFNLKKGDQK